jgi:enediyne biosynthesis protein E4
VAVLRGSSMRLQVVVLLAFGACKPEPRTGGGPDPGVPVTVDEGGAQACSAPVSPEVHFTQKQALHPVPIDKWIWHGGITAADLTEDGLPDLLVATEQGVELFETTAEETFLPRETLYDLDLTFASGTSIADYDGDGDLDLYVMRVAGDPAPEWTEENELGKNRLLRNDGGTFVDVTDAAGVDGCGVHQRTGEYGCWKSMTSSWGDIDADGDLDLYVGNYGFVDETDGTSDADMEPAEPDFLYLNDGDGTFTDVSDRLPDVLKDGYTYAGGLFDLDHDGDLDLYTVNDFGGVARNRVLWNDGTGQFDWEFTADPSGLDVDVTGMGLGLGDLNGDGVLDLLIPIWNDNWLLQSSVGEQQIRWVDYADTVNFVVDQRRNQKVGWGTELGDLDNDGDLDAVSQFGFVDNQNDHWGNPQLQPDAVYINEPKSTPPYYTFVDRGAEWGLDHPGMSRGAVLADLNRDGWLDIGKRSLDSSILDKSVSPLHLSRCGDDAWLLVHLRQPGTMNVFAVGAEVVVEAGGRTFTRTLFGGGTGYASQPPPELHFGLGDVDVIDELTVRWPDGQQSVLTDLDARQQITVTR